MRYSKKESAQATVELVVLLLGFISVFLGLILICGLTDSDISVLLQARNNAERTASGSGSLTVGGAEFGSVRHGTHSLYETDEELTFSPQDYVGRNVSNTLNAFYPELNKRTEFANPGPAVYTQQAEMKEWKSLRDVDNQLFTSDFVPFLNNKNALDTAFLVSGTAHNIASPFLVSGCDTCGFTGSLSSWFGLKVVPDNLKYASGNRVYMPVFSRQDTSK